MDRWERLVRETEILGQTKIMTKPDRDSIEMREVSPVRGLLTEQMRTEVLDCVA